MHGTLDKIDVWSYQECCCYWKLNSMRGSHIRSLGSGFHLFNMQGQSPTGFARVYLKMSDDRMRPPERSRTDFELEGCGQRGGNRRLQAENGLAAEPSHFPASYSRRSNSFQHCSNCLSSIQDLQHSISLLYINAIF